MECLKLYKHYILCPEITLVPKETIKAGEPFLYLTTTPTTPPDIEAYFGYWEQKPYNYVWEDGDRFILKENARLVLTTLRMNHRVQKLSRILQWNRTNYSAYARNALKN